MKQVVEKGKTLLVDGPASVVLLTGNVSVLGAALKVGEKNVIREGKRVAFEVKRGATFDLTLGENASFEEVNGSTIPPSWENATKEIMSHKSPMAVTVMGGVDSGKTSLCVYLANKALKKGWKVAVIDADLGQSDIGPPSTIGFSHVTTPVKDLFEMEAENAYFVGLTSPSRAVNMVLEGLTKLKNRVLETGVDFLIVNTDGWIDGEEATKYKIQLVERIAPDIVVGIQQERELVPILTALEWTKIFAVESPPAIRRRSREKRKLLRELGYKKYLKGAKVRLFRLNRVKVEGPLLGAGRPVIPEQVEMIKRALEERPFYGEEKGEEGLLVALQGAQGDFLGIGVLFWISREREAMKIYTPVSGKVSTIQLGQMKLGKKGREIGLASVFADQA